MQYTYMYGWGGANIKYVCYCHHLGLSTLQKRLYREVILNYVANRFDFSRLYGVVLLVVVLQPRGMKATVKHAEHCCCAMECMHLLH